VLNPLRSEDEAFRLLLRVVAVFVAIIALIVIVRALL
jgi:membrane protein required for beta-lactamase induction